VAEVVDEHAADRACADHVLLVCRTKRYLNLPEAGEAALGALSRIRNRAPWAQDGGSLTIALGFLRFDGHPPLVGSA